LGLLTDQEGTAPFGHGSVNEYSKD
jgi:hypothetical protein